MTCGEKPIALAVVGSRKYRDRQCVFKKLDRIHKNLGIRLIISGGAQGPDSYSQEWAESRNVETCIFLPDWERFKKSAGFIRNADIVEACDRLLAFWDGESKGTKHSIDLARKKQRPRMIIQTEILDD